MGKLMITHLTLGTHEWVRTVAIQTFDFPACGEIGDFVLYDMVRQLGLRVTINREFLTWVEVSSESQRKSKTHHHRASS
jgi:hypothetical protein